MFNLQAARIGINVHTSLGVHLSREDVEARVTVHSSFYTIKLIIREPDSVGECEFCVFTDESNIDIICAAIVDGLRRFREERLDEAVKPYREDDSIEGAPCA